MRKVWGLVIGLVLIFNISYGAMKNNASPIVVKLDTQTASRAIVFNVPTRDIYVRNTDATRYVWVEWDITDNGLGYAAGKFDTGLCTLLEPSGSLEFYDFFTSGITIFGDDAEFGAAGPASPIIVEALY